jgi:hypothetical protein
LPSPSLRSGAAPLGRLHSQAREQVAERGDFDPGAGALGAHRLGLSHSTVKHHLANARTKVGAETTAQLVWILARRLPEPEGGAQVDEQVACDQWQVALRSAATDDGSARRCHACVGADMNDTAKITRAIRINAVAGVVMFAFVALALIPVAASAFQWDAHTAVSLGIGTVSGSLALLLVWSLRRDRDDPAGIERRERRLESATVVWGAAILLVGLVAVLVLIVWALLR